MEILEKIYLTVYLLSISIFLRLWGWREDIFWQENSYLLFQKNKEGKASDIRKIHGSHKTIPNGKEMSGS